MPTYEYRCTRGHRYDRKEPFGSPREHPCEKCGEPAARLLNAPAIAFKGSGWYKTDSRSSDNIGTDRKKKPKQDKAARSESGSDSSSKRRSATGTSKARSDTTNGKSSSSAGKGAKSD